MGGYGSGRYFRYAQTPRKVTSAFNRLDVRKLARDGALEPGQSYIWSWSNRATGKQLASIRLTVRGGDKAEELLLHYTVNDEPVSEAILLEWTPCHYGGERVWMLCPRCGRRVALLYGGRRFWCRYCHDLTYLSTRDDATDRGIKKAQAIRMRLGGSADLTQPFPPKPKGMHWRTYWRLWDEADEAYTRGILHLARRWPDLLGEQVKR